MRLIKRLAGPVILLLTKAEVFIAVLSALAIGEFFTLVRITGWRYLYGSKIIILRFAR